jgi:3D (Asp-Asp-Asp) domain-containing protein
VATGALVAGLSPAFGGPGGTATGTLQAQGSALAQREHAALLDLYAAESSLARARAAAATVHARRAAVARQREAVARQAAVVRSSFDVAESRLGHVLRAIYMKGQPDPIAIILGATSLEDAVNEIDALSRSALQNRHLIAEMRSSELALRDAETRLAESDRALAAAQAAADATTARLEQAVSDRARVVSSLHSRLDLNRRALARLEAQARAAQRRSAELAAKAAAAKANEPRAAAPQPASATAPPTTTTVPAPTRTTTPAPATSQPVRGTRTLVVDAVAYHLPGLTASGLPVGPGVVAVDPTVIPLGTRLYVPGYGPAVAADVGTAIKGNIIDLWMPTTAQARAWGRRTVTITIYG